MASRILPFMRLSDLPVGARTPWKAIATEEGKSIVVDADQTVLFTVASTIAGRIVASVNMVECAHRRGKPANDTCGNG